LLSLVLLTGYAGLTSLCQLTFVGLGAFAMGRLGHGGSLWGVLAAVGIGAAAGFVVGLPTLRLRGLYLALATFAFADAMDQIFFLNPNIFGLGGNINVARPHIPGIRQTDRIFFIEVAVLFALTSIAVLAVRRGRFGRRLAALDDSPAACATLGLNINWTRLALFTVSAGLAGLGGVLYGGGQGLVSENDFLPLLSLVVLLQLRVGGVNTATGALLGSMFFAFFQLFALHSVHTSLLGWHVKLADLQYPLTGLAAIAVSRDPNGIGGHIADAGERLRAAIARRRSPGTPAATRLDEPELAGV
jgi:branched-chain amino acid transport system permease protein